MDQTWISCIGRQIFFTTEPHEKLTTYMGLSNGDKFMETGSRMVVARVGAGAWLFIGCRVSVLQVEKVLESYCTAVCISINGWDGQFYYCVFYHTHTHTHTQSCRFRKIKWKKSMIAFFKKNFWSTVDLQYCVNFCYTTMWFSYAYVVFFTFFSLMVMAGYWVQFPALTVGPCCLSILYIIVYIC